MTGLEIPVVAVVGAISMLMGAGGSFAVTRRATKENRDDIAVIEHRLTDHERADDQAFKEIMRALGRIEGTLNEMNRSK